VPRINKKQKKTLLLLNGMSRLITVLSIPVFAFFYIHLFRAELIKNFARVLWDYLHIENHWPASAVFVLVEFLAYWAIAGISGLSALGVLVFFILLAWTYSASQGLGEAGIGFINRIGDKRFMRKIKTNPQAKIFWSLVVFFCTSGAGLMYIVNRAFSPKEFLVCLILVVCVAIIASGNWHTAGNVFQNSETKKN